jgi:hypothetical protein
MRKYRFVGTATTMSDRDGDGYPYIDGSPDDAYLRPDALLALISAGIVEEIDEVVVNIPADLADEFIRLYGDDGDGKATQIAQIISDARGKR